MSDGTKIEWADATVNAVNGCSVTSPGCTNCYAMKQAHRFPARAGLTTKTNGGMVWTGEVRFNEKQLLLPLGWKRPRRIFWNAHGDLFHPAVPYERIDQVFAVCALTPQHTHMILTKRSARMREYFAARHRPNQECAYHFLHTLATPAIERAMQSAVDAVFPLPNVWLGVSVEDQARADQRIPDLLATPAAVRFISAEPLLGPVDLNSIKLVDYLTEGGGSVQGWESVLNGKRFDEWADGDTEGWPKLDWVIVGGESGPRARPMHPDWARRLRDQCAAAGVAFHFKQWGEWGPDDGEGGTGKLTRIVCAPARTWADGSWHDLPKLISDRINGEHDVYRIGKKAAGRLLDGIEHNGFPA